MLERARVVAAPRSVLESVVMHVVVAYGFPGCGFTRTVVVGAPCMNTVVGGL